MSITTENGLVMETAEEFAKFLENWRAAIDADLDRAKPPNQPNLRRKLVEAMRSLPEIKKNGINKFHGYRYIRAEDINEAVRTALAAAGIAFLPEELEITDYEPVATKNEGTMNVCRVRMQYTFFDTETDERFVTTSTGEGMDNGDKTIQKAKTVALKDLLKQMFLVASEEDDAEHQTDDAAEPVQRGPNLKTQACPNCGVIGAIIKGRAEYGGGYVCWKKAKTPGCDAKFPEGYDFKTGSMNAPPASGNAPSAAPNAQGGTSSAKPASGPSQGTLRARNAIPPATAEQIEKLRAVMLGKQYAAEDLDQIVIDYFAEKKLQVTGLEGLNSGQVVHLLSVLEGKEK